MEKGIQLRPKDGTKIVSANSKQKPISNIVFLLQSIQ